MTAVALLQQLQERGVLLTPYPDGTLYYKAPKGRLIPELLDAICQHKHELLALLTQSTPATDPVQPTAPSPPEPLTPSYPCVVCESSNRWDDHGLWQCCACWPPGSLQRMATVPGPAKVSHV